ncbi:DUF6470 family protein [Paenibacillus sp. y28]
MRQTFAQIGMETQNASVDMSSPDGELSIEQPQAKMDFKYDPGTLSIDSSAAWAALGKGGHLGWMNRIYSQLPEIFKQSLAKKAQEGQRAAQITNPANAFAEIARNNVWNGSGIQYTGPASVDNVNIQYEPGKPQTNIDPVKPSIQYTPVKPEVSFNRGSVDIYMKQMNSLDIWVSEYDWYK